MVGVCACPEIDAFARAGLLFDEELDIEGIIPPLMMTLLQYQMLPKDSLKSRLMVCMH